MLIHQLRGLPHAKEVTSWIEYSKFDMDVHSTNYTLCAAECRFGKEDHVVLANISVCLDYIVDFINKNELKMDPKSKDDIDVECGYEAGCLGYSLYHVLKGCKI